MRTMRMILTPTPLSEIEPGDIIATGPPPLPTGSTPVGLLSTQPVHIVMGNTALGSEGEHILVNRLTIEKKG